MVSALDVIIPLNVAKDAVDASIENVNRQLRYIDDDIYDSYETTYGRGDKTASEVVDELHQQRGALIDKLNELHIIRQNVKQLRYKFAFKYLLENWHNIILEATLVTSSIVITNLIIGYLLTRIF